MSWLLLSPHPICPQEPNFCTMHQYFTIQNPMMLLYLCSGCELAAFGGVVRQMLEDVQQRIVFRAQRYIQTDIRGYNPASGDLAYPDKLIVANEATIQDETISDSDSVFDTSGTEVRMH